MRRRRLKVAEEDEEEEEEREKESEYNFFGEKYILIHPPPRTKYFTKILS